jgi:hypothetical protein
VVDVSTSNGTVYYEVGIRDAAQEKRCVCIAAEWFKPLFDIPNSELCRIVEKNEVTNAEAEVIRGLLVKNSRFLLSRERHISLSPIKTPEAAFAERAESSSTFQRELQAVRLIRQETRGPKQLRN